MAIYEPALDSTGIYGGVGRDSPYGKSTIFRGHSIIRPGGGRISSIVQGAYYVGRYFRKNPRFGARIAAVAGGAGVKYYASQNARSNQYNQALRPSYISRYSKRRKQYNGNCRCCHQRCC